LSSGFKFASRRHFAILIAPGDGRAPNLLCVTLMQRLPHSKNVLPDVFEVIVNILRSMNATNPKSASTAERAAKNDRTEQSSKCSGRRFLPPALLALYCTVLAEKENEDKNLDASTVQNILKQYPKESNFFLHVIVSLAGMEYVCSTTQENASTKVASSVGYESRNLHNPSHEKLQLVDLFPFTIVVKNKYAKGQAKWFPRKLRN
jgi:hypothetical protein